MDISSLHFVNQELGKVPYCKEWNESITKFVCYIPFCLWYKTSQILVIEISNTVKEYLYDYGNEVLYFCQD